MEAFGSQELLLIPLGRAFKGKLGPKGFLVPFGPIIGFDGSRRHKR